MNEQNRDDLDSIRRDVDSIRRDMKYASLPGKVNAGFLIAIVCFFVGSMGFLTLVWVYGFIVRTFFGGFHR